MTEWTDRFEQHQVHQLLQQVRASLDEAESTASGDAGDATAVQAVARLKNVCGTLAHVLDNIDPDLVAPAQLEQLARPLNQVHGEVNSYVSNANSGHLTNANSNADTLLVQSAVLRDIRTPAEVEGVRETITNFKRSAGQLLSHLEKEAHEYRDKLGEHEVGVDKEVAGLREKLSELDSDLDTLESNIKSQKTRLDAAIDGHQEQFSTSQESRQEAFAEEQLKREEAFTEAKETRTEQWREFRGSADEKLDEFIEILEVRKAEAEKIVHAIGATGMVGGYQKTADAERVRARAWQIAALILFIGLIGFAVAGFWVTLEDAFSWSRFGARLFAAATFGAAAAYAARQGDKHDEAERANRRVELELASIEPYISTLPEETQRKVKEELASRFFGQRSNPQKTPEVQGNALDFLRMALEAVIELAKKS